MNDSYVSLILFSISYALFFFIFWFVSTFVHERVHLYVLRFFGGDGYVGRSKGNPAMIHTRTVTEYNQLIIISLAPVPFDLVIHFFALYPIIYLAFGVNWNTVLLCICGSIVVSISGEIYDIKKVLRVIRLKKEGKPILVPDEVNVVMKKSK